MKINHRTALSTPKTLLVPYEARHVPTYHTWMLDAALQRATASEPLTLAEEYAMQESWRDDGDKLTFIVCLPLLVIPHSSGSRGSEVRGGDGREDEDEGGGGHGGDGGVVVKADIDDAPERMIGDINLFLSPYLPDDDDDDGNRDDDDHNTSSRSLIGEIELMIARRDLHRQGHGRAALLAFIDYILVSWEGIARSFYEEQNDDQTKAPSPSEGKGSGRLVYLRVKIDAANEGSRRLFEGVGFVPTAAGVNYFGEVELRWEVGRHGRRHGGKGDGDGGESESAADLMKVRERWRGNKGWEEVVVKRYA